MLRRVVLFSFFIKISCARSLLKPKSPTIFVITNTGTVLKFIDVLIIFSSLIGIKAPDEVIW